MEHIRSGVPGRGAGIHPPTRFGGVTRTLALDVIDPDDLPRDPATEFRPDRSRSVVTENASPDVGFRWSLNPYRGCEHGCSYCYRHSQRARYSTGT